MTELETLLKQNIPGLDERACARFALYFELLTEKNKVMNLTAVTEPEAVVQKHFLDSLAALPYLEEGAKVIDVGTGAGFPGVPLLIVKPGLRLTLADSLQKRLGFLEELLKTLGLDAELVHGRAEDLGQSPAYREKFDHALSRAVAPLNVLLELTTPFVKPGGSAIAYKGRPEEELAGAKSAAFLLHVKLRDVPVPSGIGERHLIFADKTAPAPRQYPRKAGTPAKRPL